MVTKVRLAAAFAILQGVACASFAQEAESFVNALQGLFGMATSSQRAAPNAAPSAQGKVGVGAQMTDNYCRNLFSLASLSRDTPLDEGLVSDEFAMEPKEFFDAFQQAFSGKPKYANFAFPGPTVGGEFYQNEFETDRIAVLFNLLVSYPSSRYMAALITEARKVNGSPQFDNQARVDAIMALAIVHFRMQDKSRRPDRWKELIASVAREEHYTANVVRARLLASGGMEQVDVTQAISLAREANDLRSQYQREQGYRTMSPRNFAVTSNLTIYQIFAANPNHPERRYFQQFLQKYGAYESGRVRVPELESQLGPGLKAINEKSLSAYNKAKSLLSGAKATGKIKADKVTLDNSLRTRISDESQVNMDARALASVTREMEKVRNFDERQKRVFADALSDAHQSGDMAVSMMPTVMAATLNLALSRGLEAMPAMIPYSRKLQMHSDNACAVISRWDHAAEIANVPPGPDAGVRAATAEAMGVDVISRSDDSAKTSSVAGGADVGIRSKTAAPIDVDN